MTDYHSRRNRVQLAMFAKYWDVGKVKTRLARSIGAHASRDIHLLFVRFLLKKFESFGDSRILVASPAAQKSEFEKILGDSWQLQFQIHGDLGQRMSHFFRSNEQNHQINILIGSDTPDLPEAFLHQCVQLLDQTQLVLGPSQDGGYYLIAMRQHWPELFDQVPWSSPQVLSRTIEIAERNGIGYELLPQLNDVDELEDLQRLIDNLRCNDADPESRRLLKALADMELKLVP